MNIKRSTLLLLFVACLVFSACFTPWQGNTAFITLNFGGSTTERAVDDTVLARLTHTVTLSGPTETYEIVVAPGVLSVQREVSPGHWVITVLAELGEERFAEGSASVDIEAGQHKPVTVAMHLIIAEPEYTVTVSSGISGGTITASPTSATAGTTITLTISPDSGYQLKTGSLSVKETTGTGTVVVSSDNTFTMPAYNVTVSGEFEVAIQSYTITAPGAITGGTITANPTSATEGTTITLTISPDSGYQFKAGSLSVRETTGTGTVTVSANNTFTMPAYNVTVSGEFERAEEPSIYSVAIADGIQNGTITVNPTSAETGTTITLTISPDSGYQLKTGSISVSETDGTGTVVLSSDNTFTMPAYNVTVSGEFEVAIPSYTITAPGAITGGSITASATSAKAGDTITLNISPASTYEIDRNTLTVQQTGGTGTVNVSANNTFTMPAYNVTIGGSFKLINNNIEIRFEGLGDEEIDLTVNDEEFIQGQNLEVIINGEYDSYQWYLDGKYVDNDGEYYFEYPCDSLGVHTLTVIVTQGDVPYSKLLSFKVIDNSSGGTP
jgi:hypothetical protein